MSTERKLRLEDVYVGERRRSGRAFVVGSAFGPHLLAVTDDAIDAIDEWEERHGERVDPTDSALADYPGATVEARVEAAIADGDIWVGSGGTMTWADHYLWVREYPNAREAGAAFRGVDLLQEGASR